PRTQRRSAASKRRGNRACPASGQGGGGKTRTASRAVLERSRTAPPSARTPPQHRVHKGRDNARLCGRASVRLERREDTERQRRRGRRRRRALGRSPVDQPPRRSTPVG